MTGNSGNGAAVPLREGEDYVINDEGNLVFTREYHLERGYCCKSGCVNCPYGFAKPATYAVIFSSTLKEPAPDYERVAQEMLDLARKQPGFIGVESARGADGAGITVSYWESEEAIRAWRENSDHALARERGRGEWYRSFRVRICRVEREYGA